MVGVSGFYSIAQAFSDSSDRGLCSYLGEFHRRSRNLHELLSVHWMLCEMDAQRIQVGACNDTCVCLFGWF